MGQDQLPPLCGLGQVALTKSDSEVGHSLPPFTLGHLLGTRTNRRPKAAPLPGPWRLALRPRRRRVGTSGPAAATEESTADGGQAGATLTAHGGRCSRPSRLRASTRSGHSTLRGPLAFLGSDSRRSPGGPYSSEPSARGGAGAGPPLLVPYWPAVVVTTAELGPRESAKGARGCRPGLDRCGARDVGQGPDFSLLVSPSVKRGDNETEVRVAVKIKTVCVRHRARCRA